MENNERKKTKKASFIENVKKPKEASLLCTIDREMFHSFTKNTWIDKLGVSCHIMNNDIDLYDLTKINKPVQGSFGNMSATKTGKLCMKVDQIDGSKKLHILCLMKYCAKAGVNLYSLTCKLSQGSKIVSDCINNIVI